MSDLYDFSNMVWEDLGSPSNPSVTYISGWSQNNIGILNVLINKCFDVNESGNFCPSMCSSESGIFKEYFNYKLYEKKIRDSLNGIIDRSQSSGAMDWIAMSEGDSSIRRADPAQMSRIYKDLKNESKVALDKLIGDYKFNNATPSQIVGEDSSWPL